MNIYEDSARLTATCDYCGTQNDITVHNVDLHQEVDCSRCGAALGELGQLTLAATAPPLEGADRPEMD